MRLYRPTSGSVTLDGYNLAEYDPQSIREQIVYLPQQSVLFQGAAFGLRRNEAELPAEVIHDAAENLRNNFV